MCFTVVGSVTSASHFFDWFLFFEIQTLGDLLFKIKSFFSLSLSASSWNKIKSQSKLETLVKWLNFKKGLSSFSVVRNEWGP